MRLTVPGRLTASSFVSAAALLLLCDWPILATASTPQGRAQASSGAVPEKNISSQQCPSSGKCPSSSRRVRSATIELPSPPLAKPTDQVASKKRRAKPKVPDKFAILGPLLSLVGEELADIADGDPEGIFLYVEIGRDWINPSIYKDDGRTIRYLGAESPRLKDLVRKIWLVEPEGKRWSVMEYVIEDGHFSASYKYPEEIDVESLGRDHRKNALRARYGKRRIVYPPAPKSTDRPPTI